MVHFFRIDTGIKFGFNGNGSLRALVCSFSLGTGILKIVKRYEFGRAAGIKIKKRQTKVGENDLIFTFI